MFVYVMSVITFRHCIASSRTVCSPAQITLQFAQFARNSSEMQLATEFLLFLMIGNIYFWFKVISGI